MTSVVGLLLAAGAGTRMGRPKALLRDASGTPFLDRALRALLDGGCERVVVVLGAVTDQAVAILVESAWTADDRVRTVRAAGWAAGMGESLRTGLAACGDTASVLVSLVDLPDVDHLVVGRVLLALRASGPDTLARATYDGVPGHPVLIGANHVAGVIADAIGDQGARDYLRSHHHVLVECGDLASGRDVDTPDDLARGFLPPDV